MNRITRLKDITLRLHNFQASVECQHPCVYTILNDLTDKDFLPRDQLDKDRLTYTTMWLELTTEDE